MYWLLTVKVCVGGGGKVRKLQKMLSIFSKVNMRKNCLLLVKRCVEIIISKFYYPSRVSKPWIYHELQSDKNQSLYFFFSIDKTWENADILFPEILFESHHLSPLKSPWEVGFRMCSTSWPQKSYELIWINFLPFQGTRILIVFHFEWFLTQIQVQF